MPLPLAHLGHWYVGGPVFLAPVVLVFLAIKVGDWRRRRRGESPSERRVDVSETPDATRLTVRGPLDWEAVVDVELELESLYEHRPRVEIDLRQVTGIDDRSARRLAELVDEAPPGTRVTVLAARGGAGG